MEELRVGGRPSLVKRLLQKSQTHHDKIPYLRNLPLPAIAIVALLIIINLIIWAAVGVVLHYNPSIISTAVLSYTLGLRHALDADHISAIDLMTRRLVASGQKPVTVGTFFSLGHSTIVIITCIVVASTAAAISDRFGSFGTIGGMIGSTVSAIFLIVLGAINLYILVRLVREMRFYCNTPTGTPYPADAANDPLGLDDDNKDQLQALNAHPEDGAAQEADTTTRRPTTPPRRHRGPLVRLLRRAARLIDRPWKMYPLGVLFGLGFDTSSEIALLGIAALSSTRHDGPTGTRLSIWLILIFPVLFTAGMCLLDTVDGAAMMALYTSARLGGDRVAVCYYQLVLTSVTVLVAVVIGSLQVLNMVSAVAQPQGRFWDGVEAVGDHYDIVGGAICASFVVFGGAAAVAYRYFRRWIDARREDLLVHAGRGDVELVSIADADEGGDVQRQRSLAAGGKVAVSAAMAADNEEYNGAGRA